MDRVIVQISRVISGALALFFGIIVWKRARDPKWILLVLAALGLYISPSIQYLQTLGIVKPLPLIAQVVVYNITAWSLIVAFILYIRERPRLK